MKHIKLVVMGAVIIIILLVTWFIINMVLKEEPHDIDPQNMFEEICGFKLPDSAKIINEELVAEEGMEDYYFSIISFEKKDLNYIKKSLSKFLRKLSDYDYLPVSFDDEYAEWYIKESEIKFAYEAFVLGEVAKTKHLYAIITKNKDGEYFLYIAH